MLKLRCESHMEYLVLWIGIITYSINRCQEGRGLQLSALGGTRGEESTLLIFTGDSSKSNGGIAVFVLHEKPLLGRLRWDGGNKPVHELTARS